MRYSIASALAFASSVSAHTLMYGAWVNGEDQGDGRNVYIRTPTNNSPVKDLTSRDLVCNVNGAKAAPKFISAAAGDTLTFEWYHDNRGDDIVDLSHLGPIITWIAEYTEWAVQKLVANKGLWDFDLPSNLAPGQYLIRQEIIAHHESDAAFNVNPARGAQFYPSCVQVEVSGSGSAVPDQAFDFNVDYTYADPGIVFNLYGGYKTYQIPGPAVWDAASASPGAGSGSGGNGDDDVATPPATTPAPTPTQPAADPVDEPEEQATPSPIFTTLVPDPAPTQPAAEEPVAEEPTATQEPARPAPTRVSPCKRRRRSMKKRASVAY
ncbi:unnamed protein product [Parascedosporium putredinis]|uniref:lytic cellulose monooxygenase (C4-dehydrogenating) n=1 Tax=Parascedosporium putredinis TaxID=1442378 RepID=A0A9P1GX83_9PEZI|nr:unnamed protein product [Parascedosporium putredinis]CAI7989580.1 unnamed protein product [Parascedosporium putredinis]